MCKKGHCVTGSCCVSCVKVNRIYMEKRAETQHIYVAWLLMKKLPSRPKDVGADHVVTKRGRPDKLLPMRLQLLCEQEPFPNKDLPNKHHFNAGFHVFLSKNTGIKNRNANLRESIAEEEICRRTNTDFLVNLAWMWGMYCFSWLQWSSAVVSNGN